ncbi:hypothetical protein APX81_17200 [Escherichia coli]|uniref:hypothetical protein n=2 Tax=Escherichia coli TaxID=562 RepID=UPI000BAEF76E|nr:hypothetical protein [Escherichia coli]EAC1403644.1 hypothetical protein [Escherichia coli]EEW6031444.1 hypothetical protein [Escherichia coli]EFN9260368.1 hypothetical protein [Escherichia coli]EGK3604196.1 hypothetical protein [Escherichia coli]EJJ0330208.1 hypothetical protein [Escherichia coli]
MSQGLMDIKIQKIIYNPLSYIHMDRLDIPCDLITTAKARSAANDFIIELYQLDKSIEPWGNDVYYWINLWDVLPQITYLLGYHMYGYLKWCGETICVPDWVKHFSFKADTDIRLKLTRPKEEKELYLKGYEYISCACQNLPLPLRQRVSLLFPDYVDEVQPVDKTDTLLLTMVAQYVKKNFSKA